MTRQKVGDQARSISLPVVASHPSAGGELAVRPTSAFILFAGYCLNPYG